MRTRQAILRLAGILLMILAFLAPAASATAQNTRQSQKNMVYVGRTSLQGGGTISVVEDGTGYVLKPERKIPGFEKEPTVQPDEAPNPPNIPVGGNANVFGFDGINHYDQRFSGIGPYENTQLSVEPPDQALAVGNGFVLEAVNTTIQLFTTSGVEVTPPIPLNQFYKLPPAIDRETLTYGPFLADPRAYYDPSVRRWFVTILLAETDPQTGAFSGETALLIAVSRNRSPLNQWDIYRIDTTFDGDTPNTPISGDCPCLPDYPMIGADAHGFYITTNIFPLFEGGYNGAGIYALSKLALIALPSGDPVPLEFIFLPFDEGAEFTLQPASSPNGVYERRANGTEYFLSSYFVEDTDNRLELWALSNTRSLNSADPDLRLSSITLTGESYAFPPPARQKPGPTPLRDCLAVDCLGLGGTSIEPLERLESNDYRVSPLTYAAGQLWGGQNTLLGNQGPDERVGILYSIVAPAVDSSGQVSGNFTRQGYVAVAGQSVMFPAIGVNGSGEGAMVFTLTGPDYYPSAAFTLIDLNGTGPVQIAAAGEGPQDGFTGYFAFGGNGISRWGDYSAAVADAAGNIWMATEYIGQSCTFEEYLADTTCGGERSALANWYTFIARVQP